MTLVIKNNFADKIVNFKNALKLICQVPVQILTTMIFHVVVNHFLTIEDSGSFVIITM